MGRVRATVIVPTFGDASFSRWAIRSVQTQSVKDIEICVICDGSPRNMIAFFEEMKQEDPRIRIFTYPKSPRTGEPYRDAVIEQTKGRLICYCCHDDLWLPDHIAEIEKGLKKNPFVHSIHSYVNLPENIEDGNGIIENAFWITLADPEVRGKMMGGENFFGLTFAAHTRKAYRRLQEGWVTTPRKDLPTDLYMWQKFLSAYGDRCKTIAKVTALHFQKLPRSGWSEQQRDEELKSYFEGIQDEEFLLRIGASALRFRPLSLGKLAAQFHSFTRGCVYRRRVKGYCQSTLAGPAK